MIRAFVGNVGTCCSDDKGETQSGGPIRVRVPMQSARAEYLVVVMKSRSRDGAKEVYCSAVTDWSTRNGRNQ